MEMPIVAPCQHPTIDIATFYDSETQRSTDHPMCADCGEMGDVVFHEQELFAHLATGSGAGPPQECLCPDLGPDNRFCPDCGEMPEHPSMPASKQPLLDRVVEVEKAGAFVRRFQLEATSSDNEPLSDPAPKQDGVARFWRGCRKLVERGGRLAARLEPTQGYHYIAV